MISDVEGFRFQELESQPILDLLGSYMKKKNKNSRHDSMNIRIQARNKNKIAENQTGRVIFRENHAYGKAVKGKGHLLVA